jgi:hypothetical protein
MLNKLKSKPELFPFFTTDLLENDYGILIDETMPENSYLAIDIDSYYHKHGNIPTPEIVDILLTAQQISAPDNFHIFIVEMKNIKRAKYFTAQNIYNKFATAIDDFIKKRYSDIFLNTSLNITNFRLLFITDVYKLKCRGLSDDEIRSFLSDTKIALLQNMPLFSFRNFKVQIEYKLPNPLLSWK